jgi:periplasmic protein TonB
MRMKKLNEPPHWATWFLHWFCAPHLLEEIEGDLSELFYERVNNEGKMKARLYYLADVLKLFRPCFFKISYPNPTVFAMELKKHPSVDLRRKYALFLSIGLLISLALVTTAFEWKTYGTMVMDLEDVMAQNDDIPEIMPVTFIPPPPPPPPKEIKIVEVTEEETPDIELNIDIELDITEETPPPVVFDELPPEEPATMDFILVEKQPSFEGGMKAFYQYIAQHLEYPKQAIRIGREGKVFVSFVIDNDGSITQVEVLKGIGAGCDEEAVRVLQNAPKWNPGKQRGKPVKVRMQLPIIFALQ